MQELLGDEFEIEKEVTWVGESGIKLVGHIDAYHKSGVVIEFKTAESTKVIRGAISIPYQAIESVS
jgi:hypothetical protein